MPQDAKAYRIGMSLHRVNRRQDAIAGKAAAGRYPPTLAELEEQRTWPLPRNATQARNLPVTSGSSDSHLRSRSDARQTGQRVRSG